jgi:flagellar basal-body rod protein FlgC
MDFFSSMRVSASGLDAQMKRMNTISSNLANAETVGYKRKDPVVAAETDREDFGEILQNQLDENIQGVRVKEIVEDQRAPRMVYNPSHPQANADGMVALPNVNSVEEMANMISAQRAYEADVTAMNSAKQMAQKALEIGR